MATEESPPNEAAMRALEDAVKTLQEELASMRQQVDNAKKPKSKRPKTSRVNAIFELPADQNLLSKLPSEVRLKIWREVLTSNRDIAFKCWPVYIEDSTQRQRGGKKPLYKWKLASDSLSSDAPISCYSSLKLVSFSLGSQSFICFLQGAPLDKGNMLHQYNTFVPRNVGALNRIIHIASQSNIDGIRQLKMQDQESTYDKLWNHLHVSLLAFKNLRTFELTWNNMTRPQKEWYQLAAAVGKVVHRLPAFRRFVMGRKRQTGKADNIVIDKDEGIVVTLRFHKYGHFDEPEHIKTRSIDRVVLYPIWRRLITWEASDEIEPEITEHRQSDAAVEKMKTITATFSMDEPVDDDIEEEEE